MPERPSAGLPSTLKDACLTGEDGIVAPRFAVWHAGLIPYFLDLGDIVRAGFDPAAATRRPLLATWWLVRTLHALGVLSASPLTALRAALIISVPWYAFHATLWEGRSLGESPRDGMHVRWCGPCSGSP